MECEWQACKCYFNDYQVFQKHVVKHVSDLHVTEVNGSGKLNNKYSNFFVSLISFIILL